MSQDSIEKVLGRMVTDDQFRWRAAHDLAAACWENGYVLEEVELELISRFDISSLSTAATILESDIKRFSEQPPASRRKL